jgi:hypothetical protein
MSGQKGHRHPCIASLRAGIEIALPGNVLKKDCLMTPQADEPFRLEEATIDDLHHAIRDGRTTCVAVVQHYIDRVRAYNGVSSMLVTQDGEPVPGVPGVIRGKTPIRFPTQTVKASAILPDLDKYTGPPLEFGRMEPTASDPSVQQQFGMIVGIPNAGQVTPSGRSTSAASGRSPAGVTSTAIPRRDRCPPAHPRSARRSGASPMRWSARPNSTRNTAGTRT